MMTDLKRKYILKQAHSATTDTLKRLSEPRPERVNYYIRRGLRVAQAYYAERAERRLERLDYLDFHHGLTDGEERERDEITAYLDRIGAGGTHE